MARLEPDTARVVCKFLSKPEDLRLLSEVSKEWRGYSLGAVKELRPNLAGDFSDLGKLAKK